jgi:hypothetical protein
VVLGNEDSSAHSVSPSSSCLRYPILRVECCYPILVNCVCEGLHMPARTYTLDHWKVQVPGTVPVLSNPLGWCPIDCINHFSVFL